MVGLNVGEGQKLPMCCWYLRMDNATCQGQAVNKGDLLSWEMGLPKEMEQK